MPARTLVVLNPVSRNGATGKRWQGIESRLRAELGEFEVERTRGPRDAERIAREAVRAGSERLVVAGGDGTLSEVVSGLLASGLAQRAELGLLPLGSGGDFGRGLGLTADLETAIARLARGVPRAIDAARVTYRDAASLRETTSYYVNVASLGISGLIDQLVNRTSKVFGGTASFLIGTLRGLVRFRSSPVSLRVDGSVVHEGPLVIATAANGRYFGGGMHVAPLARLDDGLLDVVVVPQLAKYRLLAKLPSLYRGTHLEDPAIGHHRGALVEADAEPGTVLLDIDGEPLGTLPARFEVLPGALKLIGVEA